MSNVGQSERATQNRVLTLFRNELGYRYLGDWTDRLHNSNIDERLLTKWLTSNGHTPEQISRAIYLQPVQAGQVSAEDAREEAAAGTDA